MAKKSNTEFYVVSWTDYDTDSNNISTGFLSELYPTLAKARAAVKNLVLTAAQEDMEAYNKDELKEVFGTEDPEIYAKTMITTDQKKYIVAERDTGVVMHYTIENFDSKFVK